MARRIGILIAVIAVLAVIAVWLMMRGPRRIPNVYHQRGIITIVAGNGHRGFSGDGGPATQASLWQPEGIALDKDGSLYIADNWNNRIRKVSPNGIITTVAGNGWRAKSKGSWVGYFSGDGGPATKASLNGPEGVAVGPDGSIYIADGENHRVRKVGRTGMIRTVVGGSKGIVGWVEQIGANDSGVPALEAAVGTPTAVAVDTRGTLYFADLNNHRIGKVSPSGIFTCMTDVAVSRSYGNGIPAAKAGVLSPRDVALAPDGSLFIADTFSQVIRKVNPKGIISIFAGDGWNTVRPSERGTKDALPDQGRYNGDDLLATQASLFWPWGVAVSPDGSVYIADLHNRRVRRVDRQGVMTTVVGTGRLGRPKNSQLSTKAGLGLPARLAVDPKGNLYISDMGYSQVYKVTWLTAKGR